MLLALEYLASRSIWDASHPIDLNAFMPYWTLGWQSLSQLATLLSCPFLAADFRLFSRYVVGCLITGMLRKIVVTSRLVRWKDVIKSS